jgi:hypothetical protein
LTRVAFELLDELQLSKSSCQTIEKQYALVEKHGRLDRVGKKAQQRSIPQSNSASQIHSAKRPLTEFTNNLESSNSLASLHIELDEDMTRFFAALRTKDYSEGFKQLGYEKVSDLLQITLSDLISLPKFSFVDSMVKMKLFGALRGSRNSPLRRNAVSLSNKCSNCDTVKALTTPCGVCGAIVCKNCCVVVNRNSQIICVRCHRPTSTEQKPALIRPANSGVYTPCMCVRALMR